MTTKTHTIHPFEMAGLGVAPFAFAERRHAEHEQRYDAWRDSLADRGSP